MGGIGFGLERVGLIAMRLPRAAAVLLLALTALSLVGLFRVDFDDDVVRAFRSDSETYTDFVALEKARGGALNAVSLLAASDHPWTAAELKALRELHLDLEFVDSVETVQSLFSLRAIGPGLESGSPVVPDEFGDADVEALLSRAGADPLTSGRTVSADRRSLFFVVLDDSTRSSRDDRRAFVAEIEAIAAAHPLAGITVNVLGYDKARFEIADAIKRDIVVYSVGGFVLSFVLAGFWFANWRFTLLAFLPNAVAVLWSVGFAGFAGVPLTVTTDVVPVLVLVIAFTDSMHLTHALRFEKAVDKHELLAALDRVVRRIGPACVLTSLTTSVSILSLATARYGALVDMAVVGGFGVLSAFFAVLLTFAVIAPFLVRPGDIGRKPVDSLPGHTLYVRLADWVPRRRGAILAGAVLLLAVGAVGQATTRPHFSTYDNLPGASATRAASIDAEDRFSGVFTLWTGIAPGTSDAGWERLLAIHEAAEEIVGREAVTSLVSAARAAGHGDRPLNDAEKAKLPDWLLDRYGDISPSAYAIAIQVGDAGRSAESRARFDALEQAVIAAGGFRPVGSPALARYDGPRLVSQLLLSLVTSAILSVGLIALALRNIRLVPAVALANVVPVLLTGAVLHVTAGGLMSVSAGLATTIAFGIAVDDTIHFLNRAIQQLRAGETLEQAVVGTLPALGPILTTTTVVLVAGVGLTLTSDFVTVRDFGYLVVVILVFALIADLLILPAALLSWTKWFRR